MCTIFARARACVSRTFFFFFFSFFPLTIFLFAIRMVLRRTRRLTVFRRRRTLGARKRRRRITTVKLVRAIRRRAPAPGRNKAGVVRDKRIYTLRYCENLAQNADAAVAVTQFRANSCFDPNLTGAGHQPRGFDQLMALYESYVVLSSFISVKAEKPHSAEPMAVNIAITEAGISNDASLEDMMENNPRTTRTGMASPNGSPPLFVRAAVNVAKYLNRSGGIADDLDLQGTASTNPSKQITFNVNTVRAGAVNGGTVDLIITIVYRVMFLTPKKFGIS